MTIISITENEKSFEVEIEGHANAEENGKDIVCAAISILGLSLVYEVEEMMNRGDAEGAFKVEKGLLTVECDVVEDMSFFEMFKLGIQEIADNYSDFVKIIKN